MGSAVCGRRRRRPKRALIPGESPFPERLPPVFLPVEFSTEPVRNLIYHIWPAQITDAWKWNVRQLVDRIELFNGVRTVGVATDENTATLEQVKAEFSGHRVDNWIEAPNDRVMGEGVTFLQMIRTLPRSDGVTFYGHAKGVKYKPDHEHYGIARRWTDLLYRASLDNWTDVRRQLEQFPLTGIFKRRGDHNLPGNHRWHYSGTFFWFRNADIFRGNWEHLYPGFYGCVEAWPGFQMPAERAGCVFGDEAGFLYLDKDLKQQERAFEAWPPLVDRSADNAVTDRQFFREQVEHGLTTRLWPEMIEIHTRGANAVKSLGCKTVLELGSGIGAFLIGSAHAGLDATGMGASQLERDFAISKGVPPERYHVGDLTTWQIPRKVDAVYCTEVFEHLSDAELDPICRQLAANCDWLYFTSTPHASTPEFDKQWGHVNLKKKDEWKAFFARYGLEFVRDDRSVTDWGMIFRRSD